MRRWSLAAAVTVAGAVILEHGLAGGAATADHGANILLHGRDASDQGLVASNGQDVLSWANDHTPTLHVGNQTTTTVASTELPACPETPVEGIDLAGRTVSKATNDLNRSLLAPGVDPGTMFDPLWDNGHFESQNLGNDVNHPLPGVLVTLDKLDSIDGCEVR